MSEKHFDEWMELKEELHFNAKMPIVSEREIWWCSFGENVGVEINGKSNTFSRPVIILRKLNKYSFLGVPLSTKEHVGSWYIPFVFHNKKETATLAQVRVLSVSRLHNKVGMMSDLDFEKVKSGFRKLYF